MNEKVKKYIEETQKEIDEAKRKEREKVLDEVGLFTVVKEYPPQNYTNEYKAVAEGYPNCEVRDGKYVYYREIERKYEQVTDEEYKQILAIKKEKEALTNEKKTEEIVIPKQVEVVKKESTYKLYIEKANDTGSGAAVFMQMMAFLTWFGAVVMLFAIPEDGFIWAVFGAVSGGVIFCMAKVIDNVQKIANGISSLNNMVLKREE